MKTRPTKLCVLICVAAVIKAHGNLYSTATQDTILSNLWKFHGIKINRRQLCYHIADLTEDRLLKSYKRTRRTNDGRFSPTSTARYLTQQGWRFLLSLGITWARKFLTILIRKYNESALTDSDPDSSHRTRQDLNKAEAARKKAFLNPDMRRILN